jgi:protein subunit release factor A
MGKKNDDSQLRVVRKFTAVLSRKLSDNHDTVVTCVKSTTIVADDITEVKEMFNIERHFNLLRDFQQEVDQFCCKFMKFNAAIWKVTILLSDRSALDQRSVIFEIIPTNRLKE